MNCQPSITIRNCGGSGPWEITCFILDGEDPVVDKAAILARQGAGDDPDGDTPTNLQEQTAGTSPNSADTDGDGVETATCDPLLMNRSGRSQSAHPLLTSR